MANVKNVEETIDDTVTDVVQAVLLRMQSERNRILALCDNFSSEDQQKISYRISDDFKEILNKLLKTPFGMVERCDHHQGNNGGGVVSPSSETVKENRPVSSGDSCSTDSGTTSRRRKRTRSYYDDMEPVGSVDKYDKFGEEFGKVNSICAIPSQNCFAALHRNRISLLSSNASVVKTCNAIMVDSARKLVPPRAARFLRMDPGSKQLVCIDHGEIKTIEPIDFYSKDSMFSMVPRVRMSTLNDLHYGLAFAPSINQVFTAVGDDIAGYSLSTWHRKSARQIDRSLLGGVNLNVLGSHGDKIFFRADHGHSIYTLPIDSQNNSITSIETPKLFADGFNIVSAIAFDEAGYVVVSHPARNRIEVLSPDGQDVVATFSVPRSTFQPNDVALLTAKPGDGLFYFPESQIHCSCIIASCDRNPNRVVYFGVPEDKR